MVVLGQIYRPLIPWSRPTIVVQGAPRPAALLHAVLAQVKEPVGALRAMTMREGLADTIRGRVFDAWLFGSFALAALVLVAVSVLGLAGMTAAGRTREIGIRMALGARRRMIVGLLIREQLVAVAVGLVAGTIASVWTVRLLQSRLYHLSVYDPRVWCASSIVLLAAATRGALLPSLRASSINPVQSLRVD